MTWEKITVFNTSAPFGIESSGAIYYLKVLLDENHDFIRDRLEFIEKEEMKKLGNFPIVSNIRKLKDGKDILRIRIKTFKNRKLIKMNYDKKSNKEDYLMTIDELHIDTKINVKFSIGNGYIFQIDGENKFGLNITVDEVTIL